jgi:uncharacterized protein involved in exopolysaccharide biosynthesis
LNLLDYWRLLRKNALLIGAVAAAFLVGALVVSLLQQKLYESKATILTPREGGAGGLATGIIVSTMASAGAGISMPSLTPNRDLFISVLRARRMAEEVAKELNLDEVYRTPQLLDTIGRLQEATDISISKEGVITIAVRERDPKLAADLANQYLKSLDKLLIDFASGDAKRQREFIQKRLAETEPDLHLAEDMLCEFQESHRAVSLQDQARGAVEAAAGLKGLIMASEVQLEVLRSSATEENLEVVRLKRRIEEMKRQLSQMQYGRGLELPSEDSSKRVNPRSEIYLPVSDFPEVSLDLARLTRDLAVQEKINTLLTEQLEEAKIAEARDTPTVRPLDLAVAAQFPVRPNVILNLTLGGIAGGIFAVFFAFFLEHLRNLKRSVLLEATASFPSPEPPASPPLTEKPQVMPKHEMKPIVTSRRLRR